MADDARVRGPDGVDQSGAAIRKMQEIGVGRPRVARGPEGCARREARGVPLGVEVARVRSDIPEERRAGRDRTRTGQRSDGLPGPAGPPVAGAVGSETRSTTARRAVTNVQRRGSQGNGDRLGTPPPCLRARPAPERTGTSPSVRCGKGTSSAWGGIPIKAMANFDPIRAKLYIFEHPAGTMGRLAEEVRGWLTTRPYVLEALRIGIANVSAVARIAADDLRTPEVAALRAALRRYAPSIQAPYVTETVRASLMASRIQTRSKVAIITVPQGADVLRRLADPVRQSLSAGMLCRIIQGTQAIVVNVDEDAVPLFTRHLGSSQLIAVRRNLAELAVTGPPDMADTRGLLSLLSGVLSANGFNIAQATVSYSDVIFLLPSADIGKASHLLGGLLEDVSASPRRFRRERKSRPAVRHP